MTSQTSKIEEPKYSVIEADDIFEIRQYAPRIVAETTVSESFERAPNIGFRRLADYIFGNNQKTTAISMTAPVSVEAKSEKIAMTAPVGQEPASDSQWIITFTMPSSYNMETLPKPMNPHVTLRQLPGAKFAVVKFSGLNRAQTVKEKTQALEAWVANKSLRTKGKPIYARYNPPWTPWFMRRNEIIIELDESN